MFLLAWSFALSAVEYARRKRITRLILRFLEEAALLDGRAVLICRSATENHQRSLNKSQWFANLLDGADVERYIYQTDEVEILIKNQKVILQVDAWLVKSSYWKSEVKYSTDRISFLVRLSLHQRRKRRSTSTSEVAETMETDNDKETLVEETVGNGEDGKIAEVDNSEESTSAEREIMYFLDDSAHLIAQHRKSRYLLYYESTLGAFYEIVFRWSEGKLFRNNTLVDEIYTVDLPPSIINRAKSRQLSNLSENDLCSTSACGDDLFSSRLSLASSSNVSEEPPYSILEVLYLKELLNTNPSAQFSSDSRLNNFTSEIRLDASIIKEKHLTGWNSNIVPLSFHEDEMCQSTSSVSNHLSLRRRGASNSASCANHRIKSLSPIRRGVNNLTDDRKCGRRVVTQRLSASECNEYAGDVSSSSCSTSNEVVPAYLRQLRQEYKHESEEAVSIFDHDSELSGYLRLEMASSVRSDGSQTYDDSTVRHFSENNGDLSKKSTMSTSYFDENDMTSVLDFRGQRNLPCTLSEAATTSTSFEAVTPRNSVDETPRMSANVRHQINYSNHPPCVSECQPPVVERDVVKFATIKEIPQSQTRYRYVPTAEFARRPTPTTNTSENLTKNARCRMSSVDVILESYARSVAITNFNENVSFHGCVSNGMKMVD